MATGNDERITNILAIRTRASAEQLSFALDLSAEDTAAALVGLAEREQVTEDENPRLGWVITDAGREQAHARMNGIDDDARKRVEELHERFQTLDADLTKVIDAWRNRDAISTRPASFLPLLRPIDEKAQEVLAELAGAAGHFGDYGPRLTRAWAKFEAGGDSYLTGMTVDSYHSVWQECQECFALTLAPAAERTRAQSDAQ